jgi:hypothetical protein
LNTAAPYFKNEFCEIKLRTDYVVEIHVYDRIYDKLEVEEIVNTVSKFTQGKEYLILVIAAKNSRITFSAVKLLGTSRAMNYAVAKAYVIHSRHQKIMANIFSMFIKPNASIKFFTNKNEAEFWLSNLISPANEI